MAAAAFELIGGTLRFLGGTEVTDFMGPVGMPEARAAFAQGLWAGLLARDDWREADLRGLPEDSPWLSELRGAAARHGLAVEEAEDQNGVAPILELPSTWDDYLAQIRRSSGTRSGGRPRSSKGRPDRSPSRSRPRTRCFRSSTGSWSCTG